MSDCINATDPEVALFVACFWTNDLYLVVRLWALLFGSRLVDVMQAFCNNAMFRFVIHDEHLSREVFYSCRRVSVVLFELKSQLGELALGWDVILECHPSKDGDNVLATGSSHPSLFALLALARVFC